MPLPSFESSYSTQPLVNAQVDVNRAVFAANSQMPHYTPAQQQKYIEKCVADAILSLQDYQKQVEGHQFSLPFTDKSKKKCLKK